MPSAKEPGEGPDGSGQESGSPDEQVQTQLVEALVHVLIEKGVLTKNDALSMVQTVAEVQKGKAEEGRESGTGAIAALGMLHRMYESFEALVDRPGVAGGAAVIVLQLRPPLHGDRPQFPRDD